MVNAADLCYAIMLLQRGKELRVQIIGFSQPAMLRIAANATQPLEFEQ